MADEREAATPDSEGVPAQLGHYEIIEKVGQGGMAVVYKGRQPSLNRLVAIKILPPQFVATAELLARFDREASIVAQMNHSNIVQVIDRGKEGDIVYIVMEYVEGEGLDSLIRRGPLNTPDVVNYAMQICDGLAYAHGMGVVHRDLKPSNILLDERSDRVKIADFGIAQIEDSGGIVATLTRDNASIGTMNYMSPEQRLDSHSVTHLTDIYSFGVILYEMLIGKPPLGHFKLPSVVRPDIPLGFDTIVRKCLYESPADRYQGAIRHDLARLAGRHTKTEDAGGSVLSLQRMNKRQRWSAIGGGVGAVLALAVVAAIVLTRDWPAKEAPEVRGAPRVEAPSNTISVVDAKIQAVIAKADGLIEGKKHKEAIDLLRETLQEHPDAAQAPAMQLTIAETYYAKKLRKEAEQEYGRLTANYPDSPLVPAALVGLCQLEWDTGDRKPAWPIGTTKRIKRDQEVLVEKLQRILQTVTNGPVAVAAHRLIATVAAEREMADHALAADSMFKAYTLGGGRDADLLLDAARMYDEDVNDKKAAIAAYARFLADSPGHSRAGSVSNRLFALKDALRAEKRTESPSEPKDKTPNETTD